MELLEGITYTTQEMMKFFGVSKDTWKKKKDALLFHLSNYYEYEIEYDKKDYRKLNYFIIKKNYDYEPPQKKSVKRDKTYEKEIIEVIENDPLQTAKNVSRIIKNHDEIVKFNHKEGTVYEYTRVRMRHMFGVKAGEYGTHGTIEEKIWCRLDEENNCYIELSTEEIDEFYKIFSSEIEGIKEFEVEYLSDYENGLITREELNEAIGYLKISCFISAKEIYYTKYNFRPIKVPLYKLSAFECKETEIKAA